MTEDKPVTLESLNPQDASFTLEAIPDVEFRIRKINLDDQVWLKTKFPSKDVINEVFNGLDAKVLSELIYHQLDQEGRKHFPSFTKEIIDDEGDTRHVKVSGPEAFRRKIVGTNEFVRIFNALTKTIGISIPSLDNISVEEVKKNKREKKGKKPTGE